MKDLLNRMLKAFNIGGRDGVVLLLALLLAFSIWIIHNLSLKYNDFLMVSVLANCNIDGHSSVSSNTCEVMARGRATGYKVLKYNPKNNLKTISVEFSPDSFKHKEGDMFYITSDDLQDYVHLIYGSGVSIEYFVSDTLIFRFPIVDSKKVPVRPVYSLKYAPQYMSYGHKGVTPDSVYVYGELSRLESVSEVYTEPIKYNDLKSNVSGMVELEPVRGIRLSTDQVQYSIDVVRFVEMTYDVPVKTVNVPSDKNLMVFPSTVKATMKCTFPLPVRNSSEPEFFVDYNDFLESVSGKCPVLFHEKGTSVISAEIDPVYVECMLLDR